jgi:hypothetical protein
VKLQKPEISRDGPVCQNGFFNSLSIYHNLTPPCDNQAVHNIPSDRPTATFSGFNELSRLSINPDPSITSFPIPVQQISLTAITTMWDWRKSTFSF